MKKKAFFLEFSVVFTLTFVIAAIVSYCWNFIMAGQGACSWTTAFQFAIMFGIICPLIDLMKSEKGSGE